MCIRDRYECLLDGDKEGFRDSREIFAHALDRLLSSPLAADGLVLDAMDRNDPTEIPPALEPYLDRRQLAILRVVQDRDVEAVRLLPEAYCYLMAGIAGYEQGSDYTGAMALLQQGYDLAARDGRVRVYPYGAITRGEKGAELADMPAMEPFVCGFSDDGKGVQSADQMRDAMELAKQLDKPITAHCEDESLLTPGWCIHDLSLIHISEPTRP